jgi:hypothetical protein
MGGNGNVMNTPRSQRKTSVVVRPGGRGLWAPDIPASRDPVEQWVCQIGDGDEGLEPVIVRSVD